MVDSRTAAADDHQPLESPKTLGRSWLAVASVAIAAFVLVTSEFVPAGLLPEIADTFGITEGRAGLVVTVPGVVAAATAPLAPIACARVDRRLVLLGLTFMLSASNVIVAMSTDFGIVLTGRMLLGIGVGGFWTIGGSLGPRLMPGRRSVLATGLILSGIAVGTVAGVPAATFIGNANGWRLAFWTTAALGVAIATVQGCVLPRLPAEAAAAGAELRKIVVQPMVLVGLGATVLSFGGHFGAYTYIAPLLEHGAGFGPKAVGWALLAFGLGTVVGTTGGSWIIASDVKPVLLTAAGGVGVSILILAADRGSPPVTVCCVLAWGVCYGMLPLALQTWMFRSFPRSPERVTSLYVCVAQSSIGGGALAGGTAFDFFGPHAPFWFGGVAACATVPLVLLATHRGSRA